MRNVGSEAGFRRIHACLLNFTRRHAPCTGVAVFFGMTGTEFMNLPDDFLTPARSASDLSVETRLWLRDNDFDAESLDAPGRYQDTPVILASRRGLLPQVQELIAAGVNLNHRNMDGTNCLWAAIVPNRFDIAELLLQQGVDIDNQNDNGATALMYASSAGKTDWVAFLLSKGANPHLQSLDGYTALDLAGNVECLRLLRKAGLPIATATPA